MSSSRLALAAALIAVQLCSLVTFAAPPRAQDSDDSRLEQDRVKQREKWFRRGRQSKDAPAALLRQRAIQQREQMRATRAQVAGTGSSAVNASNVTWTSLGPSPIISDPGGLYGQDYRNVSGRVTSVTVDPNDASGNTVYVGGAFGGVWKSTNAAGPTASVQWQQLIDDQPTLAVGAVAVQPGNPNLVLVGTGEPNSSGDSYYGLGILRSTDGGATWTQIQGTSDGVYSFVGFGFSKIAFSPKNPNLVVGGLSGSTNGSGVGAVKNNTVRGMYYSTDAGSTWQRATLKDGSVVVDGGASSVTDVVFNPSANSGNGAFFAAVRYHGFYQSTDGITWTRLANQPTLGLSSGNCPSVASGTCAIYRGQLAVTTGRNELYVWIISISSSGSETNSGIYRSNDGGTSWTALDTSGIDTCGESAGCGASQGVYNLYLAAIPNGSKGTDLYAGGINIFKCNMADATSASNKCTSTVGAASTAGFVNLTHVYGCSSTGALATTAHVHPDQHGVDFAIQPGGDYIIYFGNDGGVYRGLSGKSLTHGGVESTTCSGTNAVDDLTGTLGSMSEIVSFSQHPTDPTTFLAGLQDNGSPGVAAGYNSAPRQGTGPLPLTTWTSTAGGDGGFNAIDPNNPNNWIISFPFADVDICTVGDSPNKLGCIEGVYQPVTGINASTGKPNPFPWANDPTDFYTPLILDSGDTTKLLVGTNRIYRGKANGGPFTAISPVFDSTVRSIATGGPVTANGSQVIYVGLVDGGMWHTSTADAGAASWTLGRLSSYEVSSIFVDMLNDPSGKTAYATSMGFTGGSGYHVFKTTDGSRFLDRSGYFPDVPATSILVDPVDKVSLYVGTDAGVFASLDGGITWADMGMGLPNVPVTSIGAFNAGGTQELRVSTYGRGVWSTSLLGAVLPQVQAVPQGSLNAIGNETTTINVLLTATNGYSGQASLNCGFDSEFTGSCGVSPSTVLLNGAQPVTVPVVVNPLGEFSLKTGLQPVTFHAISATGVDFAEVTSILNVNVQDFAVGFSSYPSAVKPGNSVSAPVTITGFGGLTGNVTMSCPTAPAGVQCSFSPNPVLLPSDGSAATVTLTVSIDPSVTAFQESVVVQGTLDNASATSRYQFTSVSVIQPDFSLTLPDPTPSIVVGTTATITATVHSLNSYAGTVSVGCTGFGNTFLTCTPTMDAPVQVPVSNNGTATVPLVVTSVPGGVGAGFLDVRATDGKLSHDSDFTIPILVPDFTVSAQQSATVIALTSVTVPITITGMSTFAGDVSLTCSRAPGGLTCAFDPATLTLASNGTGTSMLTITAGASPDAGGGYLTVTANGGGKSHDASIFVTVPAPLISVSAAPNGSTTVTAGGSTKYDVSVTPINGANGPVTFSCSGLPARSTCSFNPTSIQLPGTVATVLTIQTTASTTAAAWYPSGTPSGPGPRWVALLALALLLTGHILRRRLSWRIVGFSALVLIFMLPFSACGGSSSTPQTIPGTPSGTYIVTVNATLGTFNATSAVAITVK